MIPEEQARKQELRGSNIFLRSQLAYKGDIHRIAYFAFLNREAYNALSKTVLVSEYPELKQESLEAAAATQRWVEKGGWHDITPMQHSLKMLRDYNTENLLIGSSFELHFKALLVLNGYVIHQINNTIPEFLHLASTQRKRPIHSRELLEIEGFMFDKEGANINILRGLTAQSITFDTILNTKKYSSLLGKTEQILQIAGYYRQARNQIHMPGDYVALHLPFDEHKDGMFSRFLIDFINSDIVRFTNDVVERSDYAAAGKLSEIHV